MDYKGNIKGIFPFIPGKQGIPDFHEVNPPGFYSGSAGFRFPSKEYKGFYSGSLHSPSPGKRDSSFSYDIPMFSLSGGPLLGLGPGNNCSALHSMYKLLYIRGSP